MVNYRMLVGLVAATVLVSGCGTKNPLGRVPVHGAVTLDGAPLDFGSVTFSPRSGEGTSSGAVIVNGMYSIPQEKGLPPGDYLVRINASTTPPGSENKADATVPGPPARERIAPDFNVESDVKVTVVAGDEAVFDFNTASPEPRR